jgi:hypothetical protein
MLDVGTLAVDRYDATRRELVWTGRANGTVEAARKKRLKDAKLKLFKGFPPTHV